MGGGNVKDIKSKKEFDSILAEDDSLVVIDCFAEWCGPCKIIAPRVAEMSESHTDARFYKVDVDEVSDVAAELGVRAMPTFMLFKKGEKVGQVVGANPQALESAISSNK